MKWIAAAILATSLLGPGTSIAQTRLDHDVQKLWDNTFNPGPPGDPRTNWERRREADRREWCHYHPGFERCRYYR